MRNDDKPAIPFKRTIPLKRIDKFIDLALSKLRNHYDTEPIGAEFETFVIDFWELLPKDKVRYDVFFSSLMTLAGQPLTREVIKQTAWRIAANMPTLIKGTPVPVWSRQSSLEWVCVKIVRAKLSKTGKGKLGFWFDYRVMTGTPAGLRFKFFQSLKQAKFIASAIGFTRKSGKFYMTNGSELVGMRLHILLDPLLSKDDGPGHYNFYATSADKTANRKVLKTRMRVTPCPKKFSLSQMKCYQCPFGLEECSAGCHPFNHEVKACPRCNAKEAYFDRVSNAAICIECEERQLFGEKE